MDIMFVEVIRGMELRDSEGLKTRKEKRTLLR